MNVQDVSQIHFSRQKYSQDEAIKIISKTKATNLASPDVRQQLSTDIKMLKKRIKHFTKDTIICDT